MKPRTRITDPNFRYTPSVETDIRRTFARIRREQRAEAEARRAADEEAKLKVTQLKRGKA